MDMKKTVCNYAVVHFMPYPETEEFVCVGVVLFCQAANYFDYKLEMKRRGRVLGFFPELDADILLRGRLIFEQQLRHVRKLLGSDGRADQMKLDFKDSFATAVFKDLVRPRESLFRFSGISTVLADDPAVELEKLYQHYVFRQFAQKDEYQENVMTKRLQKLFREKAVQGYAEQTIVDGMYKFTLPFVRGDLAQPGELRAIKPINFTQSETTRIIDHGDLWCRRIERLFHLNVHPEQVLLPVKTGQNDKTRADAANEMCQHLRTLGVRVVEFARQDDILQFSRAN